MNQQRDMRRVNRANYERLYSAKEAFLRYPTLWVIQFHNVYLKKHIPKGRVLDYGCGAGNNSVFFIEKGYDVWGVDVAKNFTDLVRENFESRNIDGKYLSRFSLIPTHFKQLPFQDNFFDVVIVNQVMEYLSSTEHIKKVCDDLYRCLRPGGVIFITIAGPTNSYIRYHTKQIHHGNIYEIRIEDKTHRLYGLHEFVYCVRDIDELINLFSMFQPLTTGYYDISMFDIKSTFRWIFVGKKAQKRTLPSS